jgi:hypothetical protein
MSRLYRKCKSLDVSQPYQPPRPVTGISLLFIKLHDQTHYHAFHPMNITFGHNIKLPTILLFFFLARGFIPFESSWRQVSISRDFLYIPQRGHTLLFTPLYLLSRFVVVCPCLRRPTGLHSTARRGKRCSPIQ